MKSFGKSEAAIVSVNEEKEQGKEWCRRVYPYATKNVAHIFATKLDAGRLEAMFNEKDVDDFTNPIGKEPPFLVNFHNGKRVRSPYEWLTKKGRDKDNNYEYYDVPPINFFFCAKHENTGKIESHMWFFKGFCSYTNPEYCQMIDAGTIPLRNSISGIVKFMDEYPRTGGACGEIEVFEPTDRELGYGYTKVIDPALIGKLEDKSDKRHVKDNGKYHRYDVGVWYEVQKRTLFQKFEARCMILAQYVEYKISHYLDKSFESLFGFVSVLPGAFCTFRWAAISGDPLKSFFKGLDKDKHTAKEANMYLAEDRVMCLEILRKYSEDWLLRYVPGCIALTDPPDSVIGLIKQRRRWTNGSLFASWYVLDHINMITRSGHGCMRKLGITFLYMFMLLNFAFTLILVGSLFASFSIFIRAFFNEDSCEDIGGARIFEYAYLALLFVFILMAITKPITKSGWIYSVFVVIFGLFIYTSIAFGFVYFLQNQLNTLTGWLLIGTMLGSYFLPIILN